MSLEFVTNEQIIREARRRLSQGAWDYLVGGTESETTMKRNRYAFDTLAFRPRVLVDVSKLDVSGSLLGHPLRIPVILGPIGTLEIMHPDGAIASARAAADFGTIEVVSTVTQPSLEDTAASTDAPKIFQLYVRGDASWTKDILARVVAAGYKGLALTVDTSVTSRRERPMMSSGYNTPNNSMLAGRFHQAALTWDTLDMIKETAGLPFLLKGVGTAEDAAMAVEHGVDVVWVSNHGGRQLDHGLGSLDTLPEIVEAVAGRAEIVVDGGIQRGSDVIKAMALGANAVAIGKLQGWGIGAAGSAGVVRVLEILEAEIRSSLALCGCSSYADLTPNHLRKAPAVTLPHEMSAWVGFQNERLM